MSFVTHCKNQERGLGSLPLVLRCLVISFGISHREKFAPSLDLIRQRVPCLICNRILFDGLGSVCLACDELAERNMEDDFLQGLYPEREENLYVFIG